MWVKFVFSGYDVGNLIQGIKTLYMYGMSFT